MPKNDAPTPEPQPTEPATPESTPDIDWKAEARKWETRAKENSEQLKVLKPKADEWSRFEEASKSELQRLQERAEAADREREAALARTTQLQVAWQHGLIEEDLDLLGTGDETQLVARAARIAALRAAATPPGPTPPPSARTREDLKPGAIPPHNDISDPAVRASEYDKYFK